MRTQDVKNQVFDYINKLHCPKLPGWVIRSSPVPQEQLQHIYNQRDYIIFNITHLDADWKTISNKTQTQVDPDNNTRENKGRVSHYYQMNDCFLRSAVIVGFFKEMRTLMASCGARYLKFLLVSIISSSLSSFLLLLYKGALF